jgi:hypothetical protein
MSGWLTHLPDDDRFAAVIALDFRRGAVEVHDRDDKTSWEIETFHSRTENGLRQELFAILVRAVISRMLRFLMPHPDPAIHAEPQFQHTSSGSAGVLGMSTGPTCSTGLWFKAGHL